MKDPRQSYGYCCTSCSENPVHVEEMFDLVRFSLEWVSSHAPTPHHHLTGETSSQPYQPWVPANYFYILMQQLYFKKILNSGVFWKETQISEQKHLFWSKHHEESHREAAPFNQRQKPHIAGSCSCLRSHVFFLKLWQDKVISRIG